MSDDTYVRPESQDEPLGKTVLFCIGLICMLGLVFLICITALPPFLMAQHLGSLIHLVWLYPLWAGYIGGGLVASMYLEKHFNVIGNVDPRLMFAFFGSWIAFFVFRSAVNGRPERT